VSNVYFDLTEELNAEGPIAILTSGQAVVYYRIAIMSKDGDWILRETAEACRRTLAVMAAHGARYRAGAPLDLRWLAGGWSSHFELTDERARRVRCDFFTRAPRVPAAAVERVFERPEGRLLVLGVEALADTKRTQRAKDYPVIAELARKLAPEREIEHTTDPDRILELGRAFGAGSPRPSVRAAAAGRPRTEVVVALAQEIDAAQRLDRARVERYEAAGDRYLAELRRLPREALALPDGHDRLVELADRWLPHDPLAEAAHADAE
jgi:hypothetical protein